ncbi:MAG TPA: hypothetical protein VH855_24255 [Acetobacteraceae bacterium]
MLKRPRAELWTIMRDHLQDFAGNVADIDDIREIERTIDADGAMRIVNEWRVRQQLPGALRAVLRSERLGWIDHNRWDASSGICSWTIEPDAIGEHIACSGETRFADAMGGRGTRISFEGELDIKPSLLGSLGPVAPMLSGVVESVVTTVIPRNLRAVAEAAAQFDRRDPG